MKNLLILSGGALCLYYFYTRKDNGNTFDFLNTLTNPPVKINVTKPTTVANPVNFLKQLTDVFNVTENKGNNAMPVQPVAQPAQVIEARKIPLYWITPASGKQWETDFIAASNKYKLPSGLLSRIAWQESRYNPTAFNKKSNASGMMQIVPRWHPNVAYFDPHAAIPYAASYLAQLRRMYPTSWQKTIAGYNWGQGNINKTVAAYGNDWLKHVPRETFNYVRDVMHDTGLT